MEDDSPYRKYLRPMPWVHAQLGFNASTSRLVMSAIDADDALQRRKILVRRLDTTEYTVAYAPPEGHDVMSFLVSAHRPLAYFLLLKERIPRGGGDACALSALHLETGVVTTLLSFDVGGLPHPSQLIGEADGGQKLVLVWLWETTQPEPNVTLAQYAIGTCELDTKLIERIAACPSPFY